MGVPINVAEGLMSGRIKDVGRNVMPVNYSRACEAAALLDIPYLGAHTPADNCVATFLQDMVDKEQPNKISEVIDLLLELEEYQISYKDGNGPKVVCGNKKNRAGKVYIDMTGGTEGPAEAIAKVANSGVGTIIAMHMSKDHLKVAEKEHVNVIIAGHMASDAVGLNILLDNVEKKLGNLNIITCSGFTRIKRST
jgi:putative NIF3 family GTP cyclohydrolase 1 type 2